MERLGAAEAGIPAVVEEPGVLFIYATKPFMRGVTSGAFKA